MTKTRETAPTASKTLSLAPASKGIKKKAKTRKGKMHLEAIAPKIQENPKSSVFIKGLKTS